MKKLYSLIPLILLLTFAALSTKTYAYNFTGHNETDSCGGSFAFSATLGSSVGGQSLFTYFGDGSSNTGIVSGANCYNWHTYAAAGVYTVKHVLIVGGFRVDSVQFTVNVLCQIGRIRTYADNNSNCIFDTGDPSVNCTSKVEIDSAGVKVDTITMNGMFYRPMITGVTYTFKMLTVPLGATITCPTSGIITKTITGSGPITIDFGFQCGTMSSFDLYVGLNARYRPVSTSRITLFAGNNACGSHSGTLTLNLSSKYSYSSASLTPTSVSGSTVTWSLTGLSYSNSQFITVYVVPATTVSLGDTICTGASISPASGDVNTVNNYASRCDSVVASIDPNEKDVMPKGAVAGGAKLTYTLQFENTGNDTAFNIHILDTLSNNLDVNSLEVMYSSHNVSSSLYKLPSNQMVARFDFADIKLDDKNHPNTNKGFVTFSINTKSGLTPGTFIPNRAGIYFDINPVVMTNSVENVIQTITGITNLPQSTFSVYPNPVHDVLNIKTDNDLYQTAQIINTLGQVLIQTNISAKTTIDVSTLSNGVYFLVLKGANGVKAEKIEKQ